VKCPGCFNITTLMVQLEKEKFNSLLETDVELR